MLATMALKIACIIPGGRSLLRSLYDERHDQKIKLFGLSFKNKVGLAAGFDKDGKYAEAMSLLGFSFIEIGTVTPLAQDGNPQPRLFRLPKDNAIINRMGFNNEGVEAMASRLRSMRASGFVIGGNIGKNKNTSNEDAVEDYLTCYLALKGLVDYFVVNISSPNTPNLRSLQDKEPLDRLLMTVQSVNKKEENKPLLLKIAPDLSDGQLDDIIEVVLKNNLDGIIATNTTLSREGLKMSSEKVEEIGSGGLSGAPLHNRSTEVIRYIRSKTSLPIIGVGGIHSAADAVEKISAGAQLVQVYSGLIYEGPSLINRIIRATSN